MRTLLIVLLIAASCAGQGVRREMQHTSDDVIVPSPVGLLIQWDAPITSMSATLTPIKCDGPLPKPISTTKFGGAKDHVKYLLFDTTGSPTCIYRATEATVNGELIKFSKPFQVRVLGDAYDSLDPDPEP